MTLWMSLIKIFKISVRQLLRTNLLFTSNSIKDQFKVNLTKITFMIFSLLTQKASITYIMSNCEVKEM